jgi:hypothetical protein
MRARKNFAYFWQRPVEEVTLEFVEEFGSSLGVAGWADPNLRLLDYAAIENERLASCCSIGSGDNEFEDEEQGASDAHSRQVIKLIDILGQTGAGRRAVVKALAAKQRIEGDDELEEVYSRKSEHKLVVPRSMRDTLRSIGLGDILAPLKLIIAVGPQHTLVNETWQDIEFEVALDSGSVVHVCSVDDCPGYRLGESAGSRRGQEFLMGDGGTIPNMGQSKLNLSDGTKDIESIFQIAAVTRPLMSVGKICDEGHTVTFDAVMAVVRSADGEELCRFKRKDGGLYVANLKLRNPAGFGRQE